MRLAATLVLTSLAGCTIYSNDDDSSDRCDLATSPYAVDLINPESLACESQDVLACDSTCGPCAESDSSLPTWGRCDSACIGLDEATCTDSPECRVTYFVAAGDAGYLGCYPLGASPPPPDRGCEGLDAQTCSSMHACAAVYTTEGPVGPMFSNCQSLFGSGI